MSTKNQKPTTQEDNDAILAKFKAIAEDFNRRHQMFDEEFSPPQDLRGRASVIEQRLEEHREEGRRLSSEYTSNNNDNTVNVRLSSSSQSFSARVRYLASQHCKTSALMKAVERAGPE
eukprot:PhF_6_TR2617/c0_g1_i1/m.4415